MAIIAPSAALTAAILQTIKTTTNITYSELTYAVFNGITRGTVYTRV